MGVKECKNGPHEWRGVVRNDLQATLAAALPEGSIRTSSSVTGVSNFQEGAAPGWPREGRVGWVPQRAAVHQRRDCWTCSVCCAVLHCSHYSDHVSGVPGSDHLELAPQRPWLRMPSCAAAVQMRASCHEFI